MFNTIIIGIDGRPQDDEALALARQLAEPGAELIATSVAVIDAALLRAATLQKESSLIAGAERVIDTFTEDHAGTEGVVSTSTSVGKGIRELALGARADLIVVASSRRGRVGRIFAGDAVRDVLRHAPCPVAVATVGHHASGTLGEVIVGFDGTGESVAALEHAVRLARRDDASISVVEVIESSPAPGGAPDVVAEDDLRRAETNLERVTEEYDLPGEILVGRTTEALAQASEGADLLAIGLHNYDFVDRLLIGSTAHALLREQCVPLLIAPPGATGRSVADALDSIPAEEPGPVN